ncbi:MAG: hypothetical protein AAF587_17050 [Bacteroidota bacterium]
MQPKGGHNHQEYIDRKLVLFNATPSFMKSSHLFLSSFFVLISLSSLAQSSNWATFKIQYSRNTSGKTQILKPGDEAIVKSANLDQKRHGVVQLIRPEGLMLKDVWIPLDQITYLKKLHPSRKAFSLATLATAGGVAYLNSQIQNANRGGSNHVSELMIATGLIAGGTASMVQSFWQLSTNKLVYKKGKKGELEVVPWNIGPISSELTVNKQ